jgi:hypothetical protein
VPWPGVDRKSKSFTNRFAPGRPRPMPFPDVQPFVMARSTSGIPGPESSNRSPQTAFCAVADNFPRKCSAPAVYDGIAGEFACRGDEHGLTREGEFQIGSEPTHGLAAGNHIDAITKWVGPLGRISRPSTLRLHTCPPQTRFPIRDVTSLGSLFRSLQSLVQQCRCQISATLLQGCMPVWRGPCGKCLQQASSACRKVNGF